MIPEQREALDEIIVKIRSGRMTRRTFLERAVAVGLTSSAAVSLLEACGGTSNSTGGNGQTVNLVWQTENDTSGTYPAIVDAFNKSNKGVHVTWHNGPSGTGDILTIYTTMLRARSSSIDVMSIDVVYPAEFASNGWSLDLTSRWSASDRANYLQGPIKSCTYQGKIVAAPCAPTWASSTIAQTSSPLPPNRLMIWYPRPRAIPPRPNTAMSGRDHSTKDWSAISSRCWAATAAPCLTPTTRRA